MYKKNKNGERDEFSVINQLDGCSGRVNTEASGWRAKVNMGWGGLSWLEHGVELQIFSP